MIAYQKKFIRIVECWNGEAPNAQGADLVRHFQQLRPLSGMFCREFYTLLIDLKRDNETLLAGMKRGTRYEIRRAAARDNLVYDYCDGNDVQVFNEFCEYCDKFLVHKHQPRLDRRWLLLLAQARLLELTRIADSAGETLVWHCYHRSPQRATLLYSASHFRNDNTVEYRNKVGRANRYHHWEDMLRFKSAGISTYDFGGWYDGNQDLERLRINKFKEQFGGEIVRNYICEQAPTLKGALFLRIRRLLLGNAI